MTHLFSMVSAARQTVHAQLAKEHWDPGFPVSNALFVLFTRLYAKRLFAKLTEAVQNRRHLCACGIALGVELARPLPLTSP